MRHDVEVGGGPVAGTVGDAGVDAEGLRAGRLIYQRQSQVREKNRRDDEQHEADCGRA